MENVKVDPKVTKLTNLLKALNDYGFQLVRKDSNPPIVDYDPISFNEINEALKPIGLVIVPLAMEVKKAEGTSTPLVNQTVH